MKAGFVSCLDDCTQKPLKRQTRISGTFEEFKEFKECGFHSELTFLILRFKKKEKLLR